ncbi:putative ATP-dependent RNA helicase TDRD12 [Myiozetetes cayanensis]|uniref:putative ATP-dependent RNA helicase TDRD12 n=1 Tax=Myiozetetes cayanensis TaxID=478635 RepID=UPI00215E22B0|nr:putative ATP-dependent RNA helicase TDRD12 [Myiozetetes cayanensis]
MNVPQGIIMDVVVLKIEDPSCFWLAVEECVPGLVYEVAYKNLNAKMNQFYDRHRGVKNLKPEVIQEGQIYVVFSEELKCWCRAVFQSVQCHALHHPLRCFLVDYAKYSLVESHNIRVPVELFTKLPYRAKKCSLYCTKPVTLHLDFCENTAKIGPAKRWDTAAIQHFRDLLKEATEVKAMVQALEDNVFQVFLFVTVKDEKICVNDDLVTKYFARYEEPKGNAEGSADDSDTEASLNAECVPVEFVGPTFVPRPKLPFGGKVSPHPETGLPGFSSVLEETSQRPSQVVNENTVPMVNATPGLLLKENKAVQTERLPQFLNSDSLQTHTGENDQQFQDFQNLGEGFVFLSKKIEPSPVLKTAPLSDGLKKELAQNKFSGPNFTESYCWPPVASGYDVVAVSQQGNDPLLYIPPVLTFLQLKSASQALPHTSGPLALIVCPGWKKAQLVFDLLKTYKKGCRDLHPVLITLEQNKEAANHVETRGCEVLVTTPHSLLRLLERKSWLLCRLCHLVLDEIEVLLSDTSEQVFTILDCYKKATARAWGNPPHQIIAVGTQWNKHIPPLMEEFMNNPYIVITVVEEAAICGNVQQVVQPCMNSSKIAELLKILDFTHTNLQKVLVFTDSENEVEMIHKALKSNSIVTLKKHKESKCNASCVSEKWRKMHSSGSPVVLVLTDDCLEPLGITDASCVIHFSFPSLRILGQRLQSMTDNFCTLRKDSSVGQERTNARSVILLTENSPRHAPEILGYLKHAGAEIPQQLHDLAARVLESEEGEKLSRPLCASLKTFGICRNRTACPDRHQINVSIDMAQNIPDEMIKTPERVMILPLHIVHATNYFGRIVDKENDQYAILAEEMQNYFKVPGHRIFVDPVEKSAFYGLCEGALYHRVQVVDIPAKEEENFNCKVTIKYIDEGRTSQVSSDQLLHLPAKFQSLPPQAVEFVVCRVKPIDNEIEWNPKVTDHIRHKIKGRLHHAKIVHTLGKTAWVDPVIRVSSLSSVKVWINEYNIRSEILSTGLGTDNPEHLEEIQKLCRHVRVSDYAENLEHLSIKEGTADLEKVSSPQDMSTEEDFPESCNTSGSYPCDDVAPAEEAEDSVLYQHKCYHPEIKWFQDNETVTLKVKIPSAADTKCEFSKDKVVFSARSGEKLYLADLELQESVFAEKSMCVIKDTEAVIVLAKEKQGAWCKLLKKKNIHVSLDFEHWEEPEEESSLTVGAGKLTFPAAGSEEWFDSSEHSDTESDE